MMRSVGRGHDVSIEFGRLGDDGTYTQVCSCGHRSAPELLGGDLFASAQLHVPVSDRKATPESEGGSK
jgi:hypothetical protein